MPLSTIDKMEILEQIHLHQRYIDNDGSDESADKYASLYTEDSTFETLYTDPVVVHKGLDAIRGVYRYAHTAFAIDQHKHLVGTVVIDGDGDEATAEWYWIVVWRKGVSGIVSTGTYFDDFKKIDGAWKCLRRQHAVDANWPRKYFEDQMAEYAAKTAAQA